jgi:hypothetical protein
MDTSVDFDAAHDWTFITFILNAIRGMAPVTAGCWGQGVVPWGGLHLVPLPCRVLLVRSSCRLRVDLVLRWAGLGLTA